MALADPRVNSETLLFRVADMDFACPEPVIRALHVPNTSASMPPVRAHRNWWGLKKLSVL
jgi:hypothetical protein